VRKLTHYEMAVASMQRALREGN